MDAVLDGGIDIFINAYLKWIALKNKTLEKAVPDYDSLFRVV